MDFYVSNKPVFVVRTKEKDNYWESSFTTIANCNEKTMRVRFFEDDSNVIYLGFDN